MTTSLSRDWLRLDFLLRSSLYTNSFYLMASNIVAAAFGLLFWTIAARLYNPSDVGLAAATVSAIALLATLSTLGLDYAIVRFLPYASDPQEIINASLTIGASAALVLSLIFVAGLGMWSPALLSLRHSLFYVISLVIATVSTTAMAISTGVFLARKQAGFVLAQTSIFSATKVLLAAILAVLFHATGLVGAWALGLLTAGMCTVGLFVPRVEARRYRPRPLLKREAVNDMTHFAFSNYVTVVLWSAPALLLPLLVVNIVGSEAGAYFFVAWSVSGLLTMIPTSVALSLFAHGSQEEERLVQQIVDSGRFAMMLLLPAIGAAFLLGGKVLLLFGKPYSDQATKLLWVLALSTLPLGVNFLFFSACRVRQRMGGVVASTAWIVVATLGLSAFLLPRMGLLGAGVAWLAAQGSVAAAIFIWYLLLRHGRGIGPVRSLLQV